MSVFRLEIIKREKIVEHCNQTVKIVCLSSLCVTFTMRKNYHRNKIGYICPEWLVHSILYIFLETLLFNELVGPLKRKRYRKSSVAHWFSFTFMPAGGSSLGPIYTVPKMIIMIHSYQLQNTVNNTVNHLSCLRKCVIDSRVLIFT